MVNKVLILFTHQTLELVTDYKLYMRKAII